MMMHTLEVEICSVFIYIKSFLVIWVSYCPPGICIGAVLSSSQYKPILDGIRCKGHLKGMVYWSVEFSHSLYFFISFEG